jgi:hypothetical protein
MNGVCFWKRAASPLGHAARWGLASIALLLLSGCLTQRMSTTIEPDGSGVNETIIGLSKEFLALMDPEDDPFAGIEDDVARMPAEWRATVEPWEDETYRGRKATAHFSTPEMMATQLNTFWGEARDDGVKPFAVRQAVQQNGQMLVITGHIVQKGEGSGDDPPMPQEFLDSFQMSWSVEMPTIDYFTEQDIATREGQRVTWRFPFGQERTYNIEVGGPLSGSHATTPPTPTPAPGETAQSPPRCFEETGHCIDGRIREYWEQNGGLSVFGYPITEQRAETIENTPIQVQWFERNRLELHPENEPPYDVLLGRLGVDVLEQQGRDWQTFPRQEPQEGCRYFEETQQNVCGSILAAWRASGLDLDGEPDISEAERLSLFGLPISPLQEELINGQTYQVQWFERARFELHPENEPPFDVLLGLLGREGKPWLPTP